MGALLFQDAPRTQTLKQLELDDNAGRDSGIILSCSKDARVNPIPLENAPMEGPDDFTVDTPANSNRKGIIGDGWKSGSRKTNVRPADQNMPKRRNARRPGDLRPK
jgi:hypothetical protein